MHFMECEWQRGLPRCPRVHWEGVGRRTTRGKLIKHSIRHKLHIFGHIEHRVLGRTIDGKYGKLGLLYWTY